MNVVYCCTNVVIRGKLAALRIRMRDPVCLRNAIVIVIVISIAIAIAIAIGIAID
jgi:hypothetical protein